MTIDPKKIPFELGVHEVAPNTYAYLQPDGGWGLSNAGLVVGKGESFLFDTLFDVDHTQVMLDKIAPLVAKAPISTCVNSHENGKILERAFINRC
jgi:glyoxylase-like metal-dependent hydrolase (beta-lactamase superfamily II)